MVRWLLPGVARVYLHKRGSFLCPGSRITNVKVFQMSLNNTITSSEACRPSEDGAFEFCHHLLSSNPGIYSSKKSEIPADDGMQLFRLVYPSAHLCILCWLLLLQGEIYPLHPLLVTSPPANTCWWVRLWHGFFFCFVLLAALLLWACSCLLINTYPV